MRQIEDFTPGDDKIKLNTNTFEGIGLKGELPAGQFFLASDYGGQRKEPSSTTTPPATFPTRRTVATRRSSAASPTAPR